MIEVTRLNGKKYWVNPHQIESMEENPDLTLTLLSGKKVVVHETPEEIIEIMSELTGKQIDGSFRMFPPFYTDFGKNTVFGKDVFVNSGCHFQDQGGIEIGDKPSC